MRRPAAVQASGAGMTTNRQGAGVEFRGLQVPPAIPVLQSNWSRAEGKGEEGAKSGFRQHVKHQEVVGGSLCCCMLICVLKTLPCMTATPCH
jgi:hypothetical protein